MLEIDHIGEMKGFKYVGMLKCFRDPSTRKWTKYESDEAWTPDSN